MIHPTIGELTNNGQINRYTLVVATAKCARIITDEYVAQHDAAERSLTGNKETDRPLNTMIDRELRDEKAVKVAIARLHAGRFEVARDGVFQDENEAADNASAVEAAADAEDASADEE